MIQHIPNKLVKKMFGSRIFFMLLARNRGMKPIPRYGSKHLKQKKKKIRYQEINQIRKLCTVIRQITLQNKK